MTAAVPEVPSEAADYVTTLHNAGTLSDAKGRTLIRILIQDGWSNEEILCLFAAHSDTYTEEKTPEHLAYIRRIRNEGQVQPRVPQTDGGTQREVHRTTGLGNRIRSMDIDLLELPYLERILTARGFQPAMHLLLLAGFVLVILTGIYGTQVGNRNFSIPMIWIAWWAALMIVLVPVLGRAWCTICPIPAPGEWVSRRSVVQMARDRWSVGLRWPNTFENIWIQNVAFLGVALFSPLILTRPAVTGWLLFGFVALAAILDLSFTSRDSSTQNERSGRIFCRYVCPVSGFVGLYAMLAPLGIRVRDKSVCDRHKSTEPACKECIAGAGPGTDNPPIASRNKGFGCPWFEYPGDLDRNAYCGLCTECLKSCPLDNTTLKLKWFGDLFREKKRQLDEAFKAFIMLGAAAVYSAVMLGWWPELKEAGNFVVGVRPQMFLVNEFIVFAGILLGGTLLALPAGHLAATLASKAAAGNETTKSIRELFIDQAYALVPLGLFAWIAFSLSFLFVNGSYILMVLNDPFGWGWDLFGLAGLSWTPVLTGWLPLLQAVVLAAGVTISTYVIYRICGQAYTSEQAALRASGVYTLFIVGIAWLFLFLYLG